MALVIRKLMAPAILGVICILIFPCLAGAQRLMKRGAPAAAPAPAVSSDVAASPMTLWRALPQKPQVPEEVRVERLLAETAFKERKLEKALYHYEGGLDFTPSGPRAASTLH